MKPVDDAVTPTSPEVANAKYGGTVRRALTPHQVENRDLLHGFTVAGIVADDVNRRFTPKMAKKGKRGAARTARKRRHALLARRLQRISWRAYGESRKPAHVIAASFDVPAAIFRATGPVGVAVRKRKRLRITTAKRRVKP